MVSLCPFRSRGFSHSILLVPVSVRVVSPVSLTGLVKVRLFQFTSPEMVSSAARVDTWLFTQLNRASSFSTPLICAC